MKRLFGDIPMLSPDYCGVEAVLLEMNCLPAAHSQLGCVGNYAFVDELRWLEKKKHFSNSNVDETDVVVGNDERLIAKIVDGIECQNVDFCVVISSPVAMIIGTDFQAISKIIEEQSGVPVIPMTTHGMEYYDRGQERIYMALLDKFLDKEVDFGSKNRVNIIGATSLDNWDDEMVTDLSEILKNAGYDEVTCWGMGSDWQSIRDAGEAKMNVVVSASGIAVAKYLAKEFGTPYIVGFPIGEKSENLYMKRESGKMYHAENSDDAKETRVLIVADQIYGNELRNTCQTINSQALFDKNIKL